MAIKQCFTIKDEILNETYEVSGQSGFLHDDDYTIILIDPYQVAQNIMEDTAKYIDDEKYECNAHEVELRARQIAEYIYHILEYQFIIDTADLIENEDDTTMVIK